MLVREQEAVGRVFLALPSGEPRFTTGIWASYEAEPDCANRLPVCLPYLVGAQANIMCRLRRVIVHGTHVLCIAEVRHIWISYSLFDAVLDGNMAAEAEQSGWIQLVHRPGHMGVAERRVRQWSKWGASALLV